MISSVGGYILFPFDLERANLITALLQAMELAPGEFEVRLPYEDGYPRFAAEGYPAQTDESPEQALALLAQKEGGVIEGQGSRIAETYWFEPIVASYLVINVWIKRWAMQYNTRSKEIENFVERWLQLCEQGHAIFGHFSPFDHMFKRDFLEERLLPTIQNADIGQLLQESEANWLIYLGPDLAQRWQQEQTSLHFSPLVSQKLPSGAYFFRTSTETFG